ncbi:hypothetical protein KEM56_007882 [Ascosphaera pollenicola]|nr:hypothetical protein KEM56_007882 [Ascosphaera pollenicola]
MALIPHADASISSATAKSQTHERDVHFSYSELWDLQVDYYNNYIYPNNLKQVELVNSTFFDPDVQGRVDVTREFRGSELNTEYIFGLFSDPDQFNLLGIPFSYDIVKFAAYDNVAVTSTVVMFNHTSLDFIAPVVIDTFIAFNDRGQIWQYDAVFKWMEGWLGLINENARKKFGTSTVEEAQLILRDIMVSNVCQVHEEHCLGANQQYESLEACVDYLTKKTRYGSAYGLGEDTLVCRALHKVMLPFRPEMHCPHIGPSGGEMCADDRNYVDVVTKKYYTHTPFVPPRG